MKKILKIISNTLVISYYNLAFNNCAKVAVRAWNLAYSDDSFESDVFPPSLKKEIGERDGSYELNITGLLGLF